MVVGAVVVGAVALGQLNQPAISVRQRYQAINQERFETPVDLAGLNIGQGRSALDQKRAVGIPKQSEYPSAHLAVCPVPRLGLPRRFLEPLAPLCEPSARPHDGTLLAPRSASGAHESPKFHRSGGPRGGGGRIVRRYAVGKLPLHRAHRGRG